MSQCFRNEQQPPATPCTNTRCGTKSNGLTWKTLNVRVGRLLQCISKPHYCPRQVVGVGVPQMLIASPSLGGSVCVCVREREREREREIFCHRSVLSINAWVSNQQFESTLHVTSAVGQRYFSSDPVRSMVAHSLPAYFDCSRVYFRFSLTGSFHFTKPGPTPSRGARSRTRSQTPAQLSDPLNQIIDTPPAVPAETNLCGVASFPIRSGSIGSVSALIYSKVILICRSDQRYGPARAHNGAPCCTQISSYRSISELSYAVKLKSFVKPSVITVLGLRPPGMFSADLHQPSTAPESCGSRDPLHRWRQHAYGRGGGWQTCNEDWNPYLEAQLGSCVVLGPRCTCKLLSTNGHVCTFQRTLIPFLALCHSRSSFTCFQLYLLLFFPEISTSHRWFSRQIGCRVPHSQ